MSADPEKTRALDRQFFGLFNGAIDSTALLYSLQSLPRQRKSLASGAGWIGPEDVDVYLSEARYALKPDGSVNRDKFETADVDAKNLVAQTAKHEADGVNAKLEKAKMAAEEGEAAAADQVAEMQPEADRLTAVANELMATADEARGAKEAREAQDFDAVTKVQALHRGNGARSAARKGADALRFYAWALFPPPVVMEEAEEDDPSIPEHNKDIKVTGGSLYLMGEDAAIRHKINKFLNGKAMDTLLLMCIITNVFILAIETPTATFRPAMVTLFHDVDYVLSIIFSSKPTQRP